ncbi:MAG TPA: multicopper oxidase domain-containing protein [Rhizomicrobium sp.]|jgi:FtsP/CotA-like multicopper oxidase with cupredoxin domain|nr:multicopper oxidase domain-containing protein [Rhizomicrobium sp.]
MKACLHWALLGFLVALLAPMQALAADGGPCPRPAMGAAIEAPPDLYSKNGVLKVDLNYYTSVDARGLTLFCFATPKGQESPTLHVWPGDKIVMTVTNAIPPVEGGPTETVANPQEVCGSATMTIASVNVHFHGTNTSPACHSDETIFTLINPGETFRYEVKIPANEPPGLYWYHPHVHGTSSSMVEGGASGAIVIEGIENIQPAVAGLPQRVLHIRDLPLTSSPLIDATNRNGPAPFWDLSLNYVPVTFPVYRPAVIRMHAGEMEFWRVVNSSANSIFDIKLKYDGVDQPLRIAALDGVPTGSQNGKHQGTLITQNDILIPPAGRAEFIVTGPAEGVGKAELVTEAVDTGPLGDSMPARPIATIELTSDPLGLPAGKITGPANRQRFDGLDRAKPTATRHLYFSETFGHAAKNGGPPGGRGVHFFITVKGQEAKLFDPNDPPAITTTQGAVEDWVIENRAPEVHEFHIHQIHFLLLEVNGVPVPAEQKQFYDTYQVGYWDQVGKYPSIKVRLDFRGPVAGDFVYHCHILQHEDGGMMAKIRVLPKAPR